MTARQRMLRWLWLAGLLMFCISVQSYGQGCAQCLDNTRATPPAVRVAYRHVILLMAGVGATLFIGGTLLLRRER